MEPLILGRVTVQIESHFAAMFLFLFLQKRIIVQSSLLREEIGECGRGGMERDVISDTAGRN